VSGAMATRSSAVTPGVCTLATGMMLMEPSVGVTAGVEMAPVPEPEPVQSPVGTGTAKALRARVLARRRDLKAILRVVGVEWEFGEGGEGLVGV
jgi:hypothetical protein